MLPFFRFQQSPCICRSININHVQTVFIETCLSASLSLPVFVLPIMSRCQLLRLSCSISTNLNSWTDMHATHTHTHTQTKSVLINIKNTKTVFRHSLKNTPQHTHAHTSPNQTSFLPSYARLPNSRHAPFVITSGSNYKFYIILLFWRRREKQSQSQRFVRRRRAEEKTGD